MYKLEPHLHTVHVSRCARMEAADIVTAYLEAGYSSVIVTDHYNRTAFDYIGVDPAGDGDRIGAFLDGYRRVKAEGDKRGLRVFKGAELRFDESENDYLLYGWRDDLLAEPDRIFRMGIAAFAPIAHAEGALIIQAHPYRWGCTPAFACYLDGIEVVNTCPRHANHNERAKEYAEQFGLIEISGSDCHRPEDVGLGGLLINALPVDSMQVARLLRSRRYQLIGERI